MHPANAGAQFRHPGRLPRLADTPPRQLPMFMSAREIRDQYQALDADRARDSGGAPETEDALFARKRREAFAGPLGGSLLEHGVRSPVSLQADWRRPGSQGKPSILGGHHRIAVMDAHRPDELMPVEHFHSVADARRSLGRGRY